MESTSEKYRKKERMINLAIGIPLGVGGAITLAYAFVNRDLTATLCGMAAYIIGTPYLFQEYHNWKSDKREKSNGLENKVLD